MPEINGLTIMMAIQAVDATIQTIVGALKSQHRDDDGELQLLLLSYEKAAASLKVGYEEAQKNTDNLPVYAVLVAGK